MTKLPRRTCACENGPLGGTGGRRETGPSAISLLTHARVARRFFPRFKRWFGRNVGGVMPIRNFALGVFHVNMHMVKCQQLYDAVMMPGAGVTHGERPEMAWAAWGMHGQISQYYSPRNRQVWLEHVIRDYESNLLDNTVSLLSGWQARCEKMVRIFLTAHTCCGNDVQLTHMSSNVCGRSSSRNMRRWGSSMRISRRYASHNSSWTPSCLSQRHRLRVFVMTERQFTCSCTPR